MKPLADPLDDSHDFQRLQLKQLAVNGMSGVEDFGGNCLRVHALANACCGAGIEQVDGFGVQVCGEEKFVNQAVEEAFVFGCTDVDTNRIDAGFDDLALC